MSRRQVRVAPTFFDRLDELLPAQRGDDGTPSATDFLLHEMPAIIDLLAEDFTGRTVPVADDPEIRVLITAGILTPFGLRRARYRRRRRDHLPGAWLNNRFAVRVPRPITPVTVVQYRRVGGSTAAR